MSESSKFVLVDCLLESCVGSDRMIGVAPVTINIGELNDSFGEFLRLFENVLVI